MPTCIPTPEMIEAKIKSLNVAPKQYEAAALHLATPTGCVVGVQVRIVEDSYLWRGRRTSRTGDGNLALICAEACTLSLAGWRDGDRAMDLEGHCLKAVRSGAYMLIGGSFMYGGPEVLCDVEAETAIEVAEHFMRLQNLPQGGVLDVGGVQYLTHGDARAMFIHRIDGNLTGPGKLESFDIDTIGLEIQARLDLDDLEAASIGSRCAGTLDVDYVGRLHADGGTYQVVIPCTIGQSASIGAPSGAAVPNVRDWYFGHRDTDTWDEIEGYTKLEPARFEPGWVALHDTSRTPVIIKRDSTT